MTSNNFKDNDCKCEESELNSCSIKKCERKCKTNLETEKSDKGENTNEKQDFNSIISSNYKSWRKPSADKLKSKLSNLAYEVTQNELTEAPFSSELDQNFEEGIYVDIVSGEPLFSSKDKYDAGCGWPSFTQSIFGERGYLNEQDDHRLGYKRTEIRSKQADSHLGHVFKDGPDKSTGNLRYCINGAALRFIPKSEMEKEGYSDFIKYL